MVVEPRFQWSDMCVVEVRVRFQLLWVTDQDLHAQETRSRSHERFCGPARYYQLPSRRGTFLS